MRVPRSGFPTAIVIGAALVGAAVLALDSPPVVRAQGSYPPGVVSYDIVYVRQPRFGDQTNTIWPEVFHPARIDPGADLMLLHPNGAEEVLFPGGNGSVVDPFVSFDAKWVYFAYFPDVRPSELNGQRADLPRRGSDIFRLNLQSRQVQQLTHGEFTPNLGAGHWDESNPVNPAASFNSLGYGVMNLAPCPLPGGRIAFTSSRNGYEPPRSYTAPNLQLFVMDDDGGNVAPIAPMTIGSALHPTILRDGRLMFSSFETQGIRDTRLWGIWAIWPDGRAWRPLVSAFKPASAFHFMTQLSNGDVVTEHYYNLNNNGFGAFMAFPLPPLDGSPAFHNAYPDQNPSIVQDVTWHFQMPFTPRSAYTLTPFTHGDDNAASLGKVTHPSAAPNNDLLLVWSKGPANDLNRPTNVPRYDGGLYLLVGGQPVTHPSQLVLIKNDPAYNEAWPRAVVPYQAVHGVPEPTRLPWLPNDGSVHAQLPAGTPYGLVGTSSVYKRESFPGRGNAAFNGLDEFNTSENDSSSNWSWQGADAGKYTNADIWAIRIVGMEPNTHRSYGPNLGEHFYSFANERLRILGEIPLRKFDGGGNPVLDPEGNPDTSFLAKITADTPFTFQTLDRNGMVLNMAQTWHQVRPGEVRNDCGGCHAHSQQALRFETTAAAQAGYSVYDLSTVTPLVSHDSSGNPTVRLEAKPLVDVEFYRDIRPLLQRSCIGCHTKANPTPPGNLVLDDYTMFTIPEARFNGGSNQAPGDYMRLAADDTAQWGYKPVIPNGTWRQSNASRYVRKFQSRRSLLIWKLFGRRLDGWTNAEHPTETVPGVAATLPGGANPNLADLDYTGTIMPPAGSGVPDLTDDEKMMVARWIDLGAPINTGTGGASAAYGWFLDDLRPTLDVSLPRPGFNTGPVNVVRLGVADANSGIKPGSLSVKADFTVSGRGPGAELGDLTHQVGPGIFELPLVPQTHALSHLTVTIADNQGNVTRVERAFTTTGSDADNDNLPDQWERDFGLNATVATGDDGPLGDPDHDGVTNADEYARGTHPRGFSTRYLAEGATSSFFSTRFALLNTSTTPATVLVRFLPTGASMITRYLTLPGRRRTTIDAASVPGLSQAEFSTVVEADTSVIVDRTMTWDERGYGSHAETGVAAPSLTWYLAEGSTVGAFSLFYLLQNPDTTRPAAVDITYLRPSGPPIVRTYTVPANSRTTVWVNQLPELASSDVSATIASTNGVPIIVERSMYLTRGGQTFGAGHDSMGVVAPQSTWFLAEGATGAYFDEFVLVENPGGAPAHLRATYLLPNGSTLTKDYDVAASSRFTIWVDEEQFSPGGRALADTSVSISFVSTNDVPVVVERSMWWPGPNATTWAEAHNSPGATSTGVTWALAEGEVGGPAAVDTFVLVANTSTFAATVRATLLFEDGTTAVKTFAVPANSRFNVWVQAEFPTAVGKRFGTLVESLGATPAQLVVERAMYSDAGGVKWAAGTNALATKLAS
ncbi:MAG: hypothetical protein U0Q12_14380 [Vicinamibacterales bacterium]